MRDSAGSFVSAGSSCPRTSRRGIGLVYTALALAIVASAPALLARQIFGDDWTVYYIYWTEGPAGLARVLRESAHAGYAIPMTLFVWLLNDTPEVAARFAGLGCHVVNGLLLYSVLSRSIVTRPIAALATALFYLSPFYAIRLTQNAIYDFFLLFYLLSYELTYAKARVLRWIAPFCLLLSLSLETLIALEPLRVMQAWSGPGIWKQKLARLAPFWLTVAVMIVLRLTILGKSGHYTGQYDFIGDFATLRSALLTHLSAFPFGLNYAWFRGSALLGVRLSAALILAAMAGFALFASRAVWMPWTLKDLRSRWNTLLLLSLGAAIAILGALPYAAAGIYGEVTRGESRLLFPSQFGVLILMATILQSIPGLRLRAAAAGGLIAMFALSLAHDSKWLLYDGLFSGDMLRQVRAALLADPEPKVVKLQIEDWPTLTFRSRCLGANDMNVAQTILRDDKRERSFVYTDFCGDFTDSKFVPSGNCPVSYLETFPCPPRRESWRYRAPPGLPGPDEIGFVDLLEAVLEKPSSATQGRGELVQLKDSEPTPLARAEYRPPCHRPGVRAAAWLLNLPPPACDITASEQR